MELKLYFLIPNEEKFIVIQNMITFYDCCIIIVKIQTNF